MVRHIAWLETDRPGVSEPVEREVSTCYRPRHELEQILSYSPSLEQLVFYNDARGGFQRAKGAEMIEPRSEFKAMAWRGRRLIALEIE